MHRKDIKAQIRKQLKIPIGRHKKKATVTTAAAIGIISNCLMG